MDLHLATPEEARARDTLAWEAWGSRLTPAEFAAREETLRATAWSRRALRTWLLRDGAQTLASCETYRMQSRAGDRRGETFGIASVFVERHLRRRGLASELLRRVRARLREEGAQAAILYSEVGPALYERLGFVARPAATRAWPAADGPAADVEPIGVDPLLEAADRRPLPFRVSVSADQIDWHRARAAFYASAFGRPPAGAAALRRGAAWAILCPDHRNDRLVLLDLEPGSAEDTAAVVAEARREAARLGLREVTVQENPYNADRLPAGTSRPCDDGVPMILPLAEDVRPDGWRDYARAVWV